MQQNKNRFKKLKLKKEENSIELQKPNAEAEVYNNNKKCDWGGKKKTSKLNRFHSALKIDSYSRGEKRVGEGKKNPKECTEQVKK